MGLSTPGLRRPLYLYLSALGLAPNPKPFDAGGPLLLPLLPFLQTTSPRDRTRCCCMEDEVVPEGERGEEGWKAAVGSQSKTATRTKSCRTRRRGEKVAPLGRPCGGSGSIWRGVECNKQASILDDDDD